MSREGGGDPETQRRRREGKGDRGSGAKQDGALERGPTGRSGREICRLRG